jgi:hypothetical protein
MQRDGMSDSDIEPKGIREDSPADKLEDEELRRRCMKRWLELDALYNRSWRSTHQDIIDFTQPRRGIFFQQDTNKGDRKDSAILNNAAQLRGAQLAAAMDTGITSEAREWFTLAPESPQDAEDEAVREACHEMQAILFAVISRGTFYKANRNLLEDLVGPAIGLMMIEEDEEEVFRCTHVPVGQYRVDVDAKGRVCRVARRYVLTAAQLVEEFGEDAVSPGARLAVENQTVQVPFHVMQLIEPREMRGAGKRDGKSKPWASYWLELGAGVWGANTILGNGEISDPMGPSGLLRESGYDEQPFICVRWNAIGMDAYGSDSPGWKALADTKQLQAVEMAGSKAIAKLIDPPMNAPDDLAHASLLPGAVNRLKNNSHVKFEPSVALDPQTVTVIAQQKEILERRIGSTYYGDVLFLLSSDQRATPATAEEIRGKKEERLLQLGGVFSRYADEGLKQAIRRFFAICWRRGLFNHLVDSMKGLGALKIDFQNPLVTAQKTIGFTAMQQLIGLSVSVAQAKQAGADKLDGDEILDSAAEMLGVKPNLLLSDDAVNQQRQQAAKAAQAKAQGEAMAQAAPAVKNLSQADPANLQQLVQQFGPAAAAQATGGGA